MAICAAWLACSCMGLANAQNARVVIESNGVAITTTDLEAELNRINPELRSNLLQRPEQMAQLASNLLIRRVLANSAEKQGLDQTLTNQAALQIARDGILSNFELNRIDFASTPTIEALDQAAKSIYVANPTRFATPEEVRVSHILIAKGDDAKDVAENVLADLKNGANFADLAKEKSADPGTKDKGGDLGFFGRKKMVPAFEQAAFALKQPGDLSEVVETQFGFHILKLEERREAGKQPFEEVRDRLRDEALTKIRNDARMAEGKRIMDGAKPDQEALKSFIDGQLGKN